MKNYYRTQIGFLPIVAIALVGIIAYKVWMRSHAPAAADTYQVGQPRMANPDPNIPDADRPYLPNPKLTPGSIFSGVTAAQVCVRGYARSVRHVPHEEKLEVYRAYGIPHHRPREYEVDHLVPLELGGDNTPTNLWPQPYEGQWNAYHKDRLEDELHRRVCNGSMPLAEAQREIASDWVAAYRQYFGGGQ